MTLITGFTTASTWLRGQAWRRDDSRVEELLAGTQIVEAVQRAERAGFDIAFKPDALTLPLPRIAEDPAHLGLEPIVHLAQLAGATRRIGLIATVSATFSEPYPLARQLVSLEHLAPGRVGWNVVTSRSGDEQFSTVRLGDSAARWRRAEEFVTVVEGLRAGFPVDALLADRASGVFADLTRIRASDHSGESFRVRGPLPIPAPSQGTLPLMMAGAGEATASLAGRRADAVFAATTSVEAALAQREAIRSAARRAGRADPPRLLPGISLTLADTREEAERIHAATYPGFDAPRSVGPHWSVIGTPAEAVTEIQAWAEAGAIDGFIAFPVGSWRSVELLCDEVLPALRTRGLTGNGASMLGRLPAAR